MLDVGCGPGQVSRRAIAAGAVPVGVDLTPAMLTVARRQLPLLPVTCGNVLALPYRDGTAAVAAAWYSLHNLPQSLMPSALSELRRVLQSGGVAVIATHGGQGEESVECWRDGRPEVVTITYYGTEELAALTAKHGFAVDSVHERPPLDHEHQAQKLYVTAIAS